MLSQALLQQQFQRVFDVAAQAQTAYTGLAGRIADPQAAAYLDQVLRDKQRHLALVERLLEIVE